MQQDTDVAGDYVSLFCSAHESSLAAASNTLCVPHAEDYMALLCRFTRAHAPSFIRHPLMMKAALDAPAFHQHAGRPAASVQAGSAARKYDIESQRISSARYHTPHGPHKCWLHGCQS